jgi:hypothetical protein
MIRFERAAVVLLALAWWPACVAVAQEAAPPATDAEPAAAEAPPDSLANTQEQIRRRFKRFEETLLKLSANLRKTDPDRATLLDRARGRINEERFDGEMLDLAKLLASRPLGDSVIEREEELVNRLQTLLELLQSEDRQKEIAREKERIADLVKDVNKLIGEQRGARQATESPASKANPSKAADAQSKVAKKTDDLLKKIDGQDAERNAENAAKNGEPKPAKDPAKPEGEPKAGDKPDGMPKDGDKPAGDKPPKEGDSPPQEGMPEKSDANPSESNPAESNPSPSKPSPAKPSQSKPPKGKPSPGQPMPGQPSDMPPSQGETPESETSESPPEEQPAEQSTPGRKDLEEAKKEMEKAVEDLKNEQRQAAGEKQDEALRKLIAAKEKLEEILRQLREEEKGRTLAALEARFQRMLALQLKIYDGTVRLGKVAAADREPRHRAMAQDLAGQQDEVEQDAAQTMNLLREEGSAVAFPEAVQQIREDMRIVSRRLADEEAGDLTQAIEKDIIDALEEMIAALQQEMQKLEDKKNQPKDQQSAQQQEREKSLVDAIAELKMLRSLQLRVNNRTKRLADGLEGEEAKDAEKIDQLRNLAERQSRIQRATHDLATGRNK